MLHIEDDPVLIKCGGANLKARILLVTYDENMHKFLSANIEAHYGSSYDLEIECWNNPFQYNILQVAETGDFDLLIVLLNNFVHGHNEWPKGIEDLTGQERELWLISQTKSACNKPVISFGGWKEDIGSLQKIQLAGANYAFPGVFDSQDMMMAVGKCLEGIDVE